MSNYFVNPPYGGDYWEGWCVRPTKWKEPKEKGDPEIVTITADDWPGVEWPMHEGSFAFALRRKFYLSWKSV